jgi:hypothetical protein
MQMVLIDKLAKTTLCGVEIFIASQAIMMPEHIVIYQLYNNSHLKRCDNSKKGDDSLRK